MESNLSTSDLRWRPSPRCWKSLRDGLHLWRLSLELPADGVQMLRGSLAEDEIPRADRFHQETTKTGFIVARGLLRAILARYLSVRLEEIQFRYKFGGKPYLAPDIHTSALMFNFTHTDSMALCGLSRIRKVEVDVERVRPLADYGQITEQFFCPQEIEAIAGQLEPVRQRPLFSCWTKKEAFVKALGQGLSIPLNFLPPSIGSIYRRVHPSLRFGQITKMSSAKPLVGRYSS